jgi:signal recognition particle subunit SRP72
MIEEQCNERSKLQDVAQEEVDEDLAVIATQLAYTYQVQGRTKEALTIYQDVVNSK